MWRRGYISAMKNLPPSCRRRVYSNARGARCLYRGERQRHYGGWGMLNAVVQKQLLCDGGSVLSTVVSPDWCNASAVCKSSMLCCCSTAVANSPCMRVAPILQVVDPRVLSARKKKGMTPSLLHERHLWRAMDCKSMVISN